MQIKKSSFKLIVCGKCETQTDIIQLFNFGYTKEGIVKKYAKDNKIKEVEARKVVEKTLMMYLCKK